MVSVIIGGRGGGGHTCKCFPIEPCTAEKPATCQGSCSRKSPKCGKRSWRYCRATSPCCRQENHSRASNVSCSVGGNVAVDIVTSDIAVSSTWEKNRLPGMLATFSPSSSSSSSYFRYSCGLNVVGLGTADVGIYTSFRVVEASGTCSRDCRHLHGVGERLSADCDWMGCVSQQEARTAENETLPGTF